MPTETDAAQNPVRNIGKVQKFAVGTDFEAYAERLEFFFVANGVTDSKQKKAVPLANLPTETYQLVKDLVAPTLLREDSLTYDTIVERLQKQLKPQKSALVARYELSQTPEGVMQHKVDQLLQKYESVFSEGVGTLKGHKADLKVEEGCQPSFHKPRQVPYALCPRVEAELTRLEEDGILSKVEYNEWATPIVPVVKRNGSVRVCGDFKVSVNPVLLAEQYPLPRSRGYFCEFGWGKTF